MAVGRASPRALTSQYHRKSLESRGRSPSRTAILETASQTELEAVAKGSDNAKPFPEGKMVKKVSALPECLVSIALA